MGLLREMLDSISLHNSLGSFSLGDSHDVHVLILLEDAVHSDFLFEESSGKVNLIGSAASIDLDFQDVVLLLPLIQLVHLGSGNDSDYSGVLLDPLEFDFNRLVLLVVMLLGVLREGLLLAVHPVLVEPPKSVLIQLLSPDSSECPQSSRSVNIAHYSYYSHRRSLNNSHCLHYFLLMLLGSRSVYFSQNMSHSSLKSSKSSQVARLRRIILREVSNSSSESLSPPSRKESQMSMSRSFKLSVRH